ncbi:MAG: hypothetical protein L0207_01105 [Chlamydiae bacterium]|nr:hypothetical protein [Chlamydiota bacterium]
MLSKKISSRTVRILNIFLIGILLILSRSWFLSTVQREEKQKEAIKPQRRTLIQRVERATIRDRFNIPLAINKIQYCASICYGQIRQIPAIRWEKNDKDQMVRIPARKEYIAKLADLLSKELKMDPLYIEDIIYGKASLFPSTPFVIKEEITEEEYYRLKMLESKWLGICMERKAKRFYPLGKTGCDVIGYVGAINQREYLQIAKEIRELETYLSERDEGELVFLPKGFQNPLQVRLRLQQLREKAYSIHDFVGKSGVENTFDQTLRGIYGKKILEIDTKGNCIRQLPGFKTPIPGKRVILTISAELQDVAEKLLAEYEVLQDIRDASKKGHRHPLVRGSAVVAMIPKTGEVVALASHPRFDPNDFVPSKTPTQQRRKREKVIQWLENEEYIEKIWDGKLALSREIYSEKVGNFQTESEILTWDKYLNTILTHSGSIRKALDKIQNVKTAVYLQQEIERLMQILEKSSVRDLFCTLYDQNFPLYEHREIIDLYFKEIENIEDKLLLYDLIRLIAPQEYFPSSLIDCIGELSFSAFRNLCQTLNCHLDDLEREMRQLFHDFDFADWRKTHFKEYLKEKRREEREKKQYTRPYPDYLEMMGKKMFRQFWNEHRWNFLHIFITETILERQSSDLQIYFARLIDLRKSLAKKEMESLDYLKEITSSLPHPTSFALLKSLRPFRELTQPLQGKYPHLRKIGPLQLEKHLASAFYPLTGVGHGRSQGFRQAAPLGSVFKLIPSYQALYEKYEELKEPFPSYEKLNPLAIVDISKNVPKMKNGIAGYFASGEEIKIYHRGGRLPRTSSLLGKIDLLEALERSSNIYFSLLAEHCFKNPASLATTASLFGFGELTEIDLPYEYKGNIPNDLSQNKTGLYSFAIGHHTLVVTPLQTAVMVSAIANGGKIIKPQIIKLIAGKESKLEEDISFEKENSAFKEEFSLIGLTFPLFTEAIKNQHNTAIFSPKIKIKRTLPFPDPLRQILLTGMRRVVNGEKGSARPAVFYPPHHNERGLKDYIHLSPYLAAKTGTAQILYKQTIDRESKAEMEAHTSFVCISFLDSTFENPDLVVVVYLRFGNSGKVGAPIAARLIQKWREICSRN